jgi:hypothetical protein
MAESIKDKLDAAGHKISEAATKVGHAVSEKAEEAADWAKETTHEAGNRIEETAHKVEHKAKEVFGGHSAAGNSAIKEHMEVYASCGTKVGKVDHVEGDHIKLTKNDSADGMHHLIPTAWVAKVDSHVHLTKDHNEVQSGWRSV